MTIDECFQSLPRLETSRLILRQITRNNNDGRDSLEFINDYSVYRYWGLYDEADDADGRHKPVKQFDLEYNYRETMEEYKNGSELTWLLELKSSHKVIGEIVLYDFRLKKQADIGYRLNKNYWGAGYATEAGQAVIKLAFEELNLVRLQIRCFKSNPGSVRVAEKLGFSKEGLILQGAIINVITDYYIFGLLRETYEKNPIPDSDVKIIF